MALKSSPDDRETWALDDFTSIASPSVAAESRTVGSKTLRAGFSFPRYGQTVQAGVQLPAGGEPSVRRQLVDDVGPIG
jgi:hypothetical protein